MLSRIPGSLPLKWARNQFLQVLVNQFTLTRPPVQKGGVRGAQLALTIDDDAPTIWLRESKSGVNAGLADFDHIATDWQARLDRFLLEGEGDELRFDDVDGMRFRYASGGTLPIVRISGKEYYCLFYREIAPIGWNIANGGCDSAEELRDPRKTIERELREELVVIDRRNERRYLFDPEVAEFLELPEFVQARRLWQKILGNNTFLSWKAFGLPLKWLDGPDSLRIEFGNEPDVQIEGCFLNITTADFGIEIDRIAKIHLDEDATLCDGEIIRDQLVNAPVGLFEVERINHQLVEMLSGNLPMHTAFLPDFFFYDGVRYDGRELDRIIHKKFMPSLQGVHIERELEVFANTEHRFGLCPITERIVRRYLPLHRRSTGTERPYSVFVSHASQDIAVARAVFDFVRERMGDRVFFSDETIRDTNFSRAIDDALEASECLIVVGSHLDHLVKGWVEYEWRSFHNDLNNRRKSKGALVPFIADSLDSETLPRPLRNRQLITYPHGQVERGFERLSRWLPS